MKHKTISPLYVQPMPNGIFRLYRKIWYDYTFSSEEELGLYSRTKNDEIPDETISVYNIKSGVETLSFKRINEG